MIQIPNQFLIKQSQFQALTDTVSNTKPIQRRIQRSIRGS